MVDQRPGWRRLRGRSKPQLISHTLHFTTGFKCKIALIHLNSEWLFWIVTILFCIVATRNERIIIAKHIY